MSKHIIKFNPETFTFEKVKRTTKDILAKVFSHLSVGVILAILLSFFLYYYIDSPKERMLKYEISQYKNQLQAINEKLDELDTVISNIENRDDNVYRVLLDVDPVSEDVRIGGYGGSNHFEQFIGLTYGELLSNTSEKLDALSRRTYTQAHSLDEVYKLAVTKEKMLACIPAIRPIRENETTRIASFYGYRIDPIYKVTKFHDGLDFSAQTGTEIIASGDGVVREAYKNGIGDGYGRYVVIDHGFSYATVYAHMNTVNVKKGEKVKRGQVIGYVGNTGKSSGPHLHYEVRKDNRPVDPINYFYNDITPDEYETLIELSSVPGQSMD